MATASSKQAPTKLKRRWGKTEQRRRLNAILILLPPALLVFTIFVILPVFGAGLP